MREKRQTLLWEYHNQFMEIVFLFQGVGLSTTWPHTACLQGWDSLQRKTQWGRVGICQYRKLAEWQRSVSKRRHVVLIGDIRVFLHALKINSFNYKKITNKNKSEILCKWWCMLINTNNTNNKKRVCETFIDHACRRYNDQLSYVILGKIIIQESILGQMDRFGVNCPVMITATHHH